MTCFKQGSSLKEKTKPRVKLADFQWLISQGESGDTD